VQATKAIDPRVLEFATSTQRRYIEAVQEHGGIDQAAKALGVNNNTISSALYFARKKAALQGIAPEQDMTHEAPNPFVVKGVSTYYGKDGEKRGQWVKTALDRSKAEEVIRQFVTDLAQEAKGLSPIVKPPMFTSDELLAVYPMGDPHFGMYAWAEEAGEDFDLDIAEQLTKAAIDRLVASAPPAKVGLVLELGDFFHSDNDSNQTARNHNALDVDTRWARVMQIGLRAMVYTVIRGLEKHEQIVVRIVKGNHDTHSSFALALALDAFFHNNPRVVVDLSPATFWYYEFGKVLIGATHGDTTKMPALPGVMACDRPEAWGRTSFRYWYQGHIHHQDRKEFPGCVVEAFRTLAARDAWHAGQGYRAGRDMNLIVHHRQYGEIERHRCDLAMLT